MRHKVEVTKDEFEQFLKDTPGLKFDGMRYTESQPVQENSKTIWHKPLAVAEKGKFYLVKDA